MYSCYEIRKIYANCHTVSEVLKASEAFDSVIEQKGLTDEQQRFNKAEEIIRVRQIRANQRKN